MVARVAEEIVPCARAKGSRVAGTGSLACIVDGIIVLSLISTGPKGKEQHIDNNLISCPIPSIVLPNQTDISCLDIQPSSIRHGQIEQRESEEHPTLSI